MSQIIEAVKHCIILWGLEISFPDMKLSYINHGKNPTLWTYNLFFIASSLCHSLVRHTCGQQAKNPLFSTAGSSTFSFSAVGVR
jgi:hypothetical protein